MRSRRSAFLLAVPLAVAVACGGSTKTHGQLMVVIDTDLSVPKDIDTIGLLVSANGGVLYNQESAAGAGQLTLPSTIGIIEGTSPTTPVTVRVLGRKANQLVVLSEVVTTVPDGRLAMLRMPLQWLCEGFANDGQSSQGPAEDDGSATSTCAGAEQMCVAGTCVSEVVDSSKLPDFDPTQVFGGASAPGTSGQCFDTLGCFASGYVEAVDPGDCTIPGATGGAGASVALVLPKGGAGICDNNTCLVPLDQASGNGWTDLGNGRFQLPPAVCTELTAGKVVGVAVTTSCATKTPATPTCGPWSSASDNPGTPDAAAPDGASSEPSLDAGGDAPVPSEDAGARDGSAPADAGAVCATFTINQSVCNVVAKTGCTGTEECAVNAATAASECVGIGAVGLGGACGGVDASASASCAPGLYCLGGSCAPYCCSNEDCPVDAGYLGCSQQPAGDAGSSVFFGVCTTL